MRKLLLLPLALFVLIQVACNKDEVPVQLTPPRLIIDVQDQYETPPSKVSVFFRVEDEDGNPVAGLAAENFTIYEQGRNDDAPRLISEDEAERIIGDNDQVFDYRVLLLLDLSGSVINNDLEQLKAAAREFVIDVMQADESSSTKVGVWGFDGANHLLPIMDFTNNPVALQEAINNINPLMSQDSSTDLFGAIIKGTELAQSAIQSAELQGFLSGGSVIVFTDGTDQAARFSKDEAYEVVDNANEKINYYTIGLGNEIDSNVLQRLGKNSSVFAEDSENLTESFEDIAQIIHNETNSFYLFEYCTPKRHGSGMNDLIIEVKDTDEYNVERRGEKRTSFDATGFESGCVLY